MSSVSASSVDPGRAGGYAGDVGEIHSLPEQSFPRQVVRARLLPEEEARSLPPAPGSTQSPVTPLTRFLGPLLTVANPAWTGDPIPRMRALQKVLVEHSLTLAEDDRSECMSAISMVERAVQLRLRFQQMRMTLSEMEAKPELKPEHPKAE